MLFIGETGCRLQTGYIASWHSVNYHYHQRRHSRQFCFITVAVLWPFYFSVYIRSHVLCPRRKPQTIVVSL